jgi:hypothetical protein
MPQTNAPSADHILRHNPACDVGMASLPANSQACSEIGIERVAMPHIYTIPFYYFDGP